MPVSVVLIARLSTRERFGRLQVALLLIDAIEAVEAARDVQVLFAEELAPHRQPLLDQRLRIAPAGRG